MSFNYSKLLGKMKEKGITQCELAKAINTTTPTLNMKLNNNSRFRQDEIFNICNTLDIPCDELGEYFFKEKV